MLTKNKQKKKNQVKQRRLFHIRSFWLSSFCLPSSTLGLLKYLMKRLEHIFGIMREPLSLPTWQRPHAGSSMPLPGWRVTSQKWYFPAHFPLWIGSCNYWPCRQGDNFTAGCCLCRSIALLEREQEIVPPCVSSAEVNNISASLLCKPESN